MQGLTNIILDTKRLMLREFRMEDAEFIFRNWSNDEDNLKYTLQKKHKNVEDSLKQVADFIKNFGKNNMYTLAICLKNSPEPIGFIESFNYNYDINSIEIRFCLSKKHWNNGYMTEAIRVFTNFLFDFSNINRIQSSHDPRNLSAGKVLLNNKFILEGRTRESNINNLGISDLSIYGLLKDDKKIN